MSVLLKRKGNALVHLALFGWRRYFPRQLLFQKLSGYDLLAFVEQRGHFIEMLDDKCPSESFCSFRLLEEFKAEADKDFPDLSLLLRGKLWHFRQMFDRPVGARRLPE